MNDISDIDLNYKALYEQAKVKLDKIEHERLKNELDEKLSIRYNLTSSYRSEKLKEHLKNHNFVLAFLEGNSKEEVEKHYEAIKKYGWETVTQIYNELFDDATKPDEETEPEEEK